MSDKEQYDISTGAQTTVAMAGAEQTAHDALVGATYDTADDLYDAAVAAAAVIDTATVPYFTFATTSGPTTTSTSYVDLTDMVGGLTTLGTKLLVIATSVFTHTTAGASITLGISLDGAAEVSDVSLSEPVNGYAFAITTFKLFESMSPGFHTWKMRWKTSAATATAYTTQRYMVALDLVR